MLAALPICKPNWPISSYQLVQVGRPEPALRTHYVGYITQFLSIYATLTAILC